MGFWIYMFILNLLLPITMILFGRAFFKKAPKDINSLFGYRTCMSMKNRETWEFSHRYCGRVWLIGGVAFLPIAIAVMIAFIGRDTTTVGYVGAAIMICPLIFMILSVILTEKALKKKFDQNGKIIERVENCAEDTKNYYSEQDKAK